MELRAQNQVLFERVKELEARLNKDSHNSSKPPSSDGLAKKPAPKSLREQGVRPSGGQIGHLGHTLRMSAAPTRRIVLDLSACSNCGADLRDVPVRGHEDRQVFDLPMIALEVTQYSAERKRCPRCGLKQRAGFDAEVTQPAQYGSRIKGLALYLSAQQLLPWERIKQMLGDLFGCSLSEGTLQSALQQAGQTLDAVTNLIKNGVKQSEVVNFDESGVRIDGKLNWLHVACTESLTYYETHVKRGPAAFDAIGILRGFSGKAVHDGYPPYWSYCEAHTLCNAHHLRELTFVDEQYKQKWAADMKALLLKIKQAVDEAKAKQAPALPLLRRYLFELDYDELIDQGYLANPEALKCGRTGIKQSKGFNLVSRLNRYKRETLAFMNDFSVPFDNNQAERDIRMIKIRQKISGCFRTREGSDIFNRIRGYVSTMRKQGHNALAVLESVARGAPTMPNVPAPS